jgi:KDO2-lipid IV(A) lauroyltransferase
VAGAIPAAQSLGWRLSTRIIGPPARLSQAGYGQSEPDLSQHAPRAKIGDCRQVLDNAGRTFTENMFPAQFQAQNPKIMLHGAGLEAVLQAHKDGRPIMFYSGHFGNHEAFRAALYKHGIKVGGMVRRMANPYFDVQYKRMLDINGRGGPVFEADKHGTLAMVKSLKTGTALVLLLDLALSYGMPVTFMGRSVYCSVTAASFALKTKALFVPYFSMRNSDGESFSVEIGPLSNTATLRP